MCDNAIFVASCVNKAIANEIRWPSIEEIRQLATHIPQLPSYIRFVDGTLVKFRRPYENEHHSQWY